MDDSYLSIEQISEHLDFGRDAVRARVTAKPMTAHRLGRLWKLEKEELDTTSGGNR